MWIIDTDHIAPMDNEALNREGRHSRDYKAAEFAQADLVDWRVKDDDGGVYYEGRMTRERLDSDESRAFGPLDWAMDDAGATSMEYRENGVWEVL